MYRNSFIKRKGQCGQSLCRSVTGESRASRLQYLLNDSKKDIQVILFECEAETLGPAAKMIVIITMVITSEGILEASPSCHEPQCQAQQDCLIQDLLVRSIKVVKQDVWGLLQAQLELNVA